jgi:hypothetical protein
MIASKAHEKGTPTHDFTVPGYNVKPLANAAKVWAGGEDAAVKIIDAAEQKKLGVNFFSSSTGFKLLKKHVYGKAEELYNINYIRPPPGLMTSPRQLKSTAANIKDDEAS